MPRDLADVIHHFLPEEPVSPTESLPTPLRSTLQHGLGPSRQTPVALPVMALPIDDGDVVRTALAWNLTVEIARLGGRAVFVAPESAEGSAHWPREGAGPLGTEVLLVPANSLGELHRFALDAAVRLAEDAYGGGVVIVRVPPRWIADAQAGGGSGLLRWNLLLTSPDRRDLAETYGLAKLLLRANQNADAHVGITIHGARKIADAKRAFTHLADTAAHHLGRGLTSYGMLLDDLHVYRAIVSQRPIGLAHPQSRAARALGDVAGMLMETARERALV